GDLLDVLNSTTGAVLFSYTANAPFLAAPSIANGIIYVGNSNGLVMAFGLPSGGGAAPASPSGASGPVLPTPALTGAIDGRVVASAIVAPSAFGVVMAARRG
ncbi:MAG: PQQ-binding-like beta-propeller repeat protein, partial [Thermoplasmata archaeon]